jgi:hypothetical protein
MAYEWKDHGAEVHIRFDIQCMFVRAGETCSSPERAAEGVAGGGMMRARGFCFGKSPLFSKRDSCAGGYFVVGGSACLLRDPFCSTQRAARYFSYLNIVDTPTQRRLWAVCVWLLTPALGARGRLSSACRWTEPESVMSCTPSRPTS